MQINGCRCTVKRLAGRVQGGWTAQRTAVFSSSTPLPKRVHDQAAPPIYSHHLIPADFLRLALLGRIKKNPLPLRNSNDALGRQLVFLTEEGHSKRLREALLKEDISYSVVQSHDGQDGFALPELVSNGTFTMEGWLISRKLSAASKIHSIVRLVLVALRIDHGLAQLEDLRPYIESALMRYKYGNGKRPSKSLKPSLHARTKSVRHHLKPKEFTLLMGLNTIASAFLRHSVPLGVKLCRLGMRLSAKAQSATTMRQYLIDCHVNSGYGITVKQWRFIIRTLARYSEKPIKEGTRFGAWQRSDALRLLTGFRVAGLGGPGERREICIVDCLDIGEPEMIKVYVEGLGKLGASEALWNLWLSLRQSLRDQEGTHSEDKEPDVKQQFWSKDMAQAFVQAFMAARDPERALQVSLEQRFPPSLDTPLWRYLSDSGRLGYAIARDLFGERIRRRLQDTEHEVALVEICLGVRWVERSDGGYHVQVDHALEQS